MLRLRPYIRLAMLLLLLAPNPVRADVAAVTASPARANVNITRSTIVTVNWRVEEDAGVAQTVSSPRGQFIANNQVLATVNTNLSKLSPASPAARFITFTESIEVPSALVVQALKLGASSLRYRRTFSDSGGSATGFIILAPAGSGGADFQLRRIELKFDDEARVRVVPQETALTAIAEINFSGSGRLRAEWIVRDPTNIAGQQLRILAIVARNLSGGRRVIIRSPELPTSIQGPYLLEFRVVEPTLNRVAPSLDYYVTTPSIGVPPSNAELRVTGPTNGAPLTPESRFSWDPVGGAKIYVIEVYSLDPRFISQSDQSPIVPGHRNLGPTQKPIAGKIVRGQTTDTALATITTAHLTPNKSYLWLVKAIGPRGSIIKQSRLNELFYSP